MVSFNLMVMQQMRHSNEKRLEYYYAIGHKTIIALINSKSPTSLKSRFNVHRDNRKLTRYGHITGSAAKELCMSKTPLIA